LVWPRAQAWSFYFLPVAQEDRGGDFVSWLEVQVRLAEFDRKKKRQTWAGVSGVVDLRTAASMMKKTAASHYCKSA
jgi:hypothetical protein